MSISNEIRRAATSTANHPERDNMFLLTLTPVQTVSKILAHPEKISTKVKTSLQRNSTLSSLKLLDTCFS